MGAMDHVEIKVIKSREDPVKISDKTQEDAVPEHEEDLCPMCHVGRVFKTQKTQNILNALCVVIGK